MIILLHPGQPVPATRASEKQPMCGCGKKGRRTSLPSHAGESWFSALSRANWGECRLALLVTPLSLEKAMPSPW